MNPIERPKGVKLYKKQKAQKQNSDHANLKVKLNVDDEVSFAKAEKNQDTSSQSPKKRKHNRNTNEEVEDSHNSLNSNGAANKHKVKFEKKKKNETTTFQGNVPIKSILKKRQSESDDSNPKKKAKIEGLTGKERKMLHLNKKKKEKDSTKVSNVTAEIEEAIKKGNLSKKEWKKLTKERKMLKMQKKGKGEHFELTQTLKNLWEDLRREDCKSEKKSQLLKQACDLLKGRVKEFTFAHDTVRVLECILSEGAETHRTLLFEELKNDIIPLSKSKYGKFFVQKLLKYGTKQQKEHVMKAFHGKVVKLIKHTEAADVLEFAFNECANASQRFEFVQEFYDPTYMYFKNHEVSTLNELLEKEPNKKPSIIKRMKEELMKMLDKSVIKHSIVHHVLWQFMIHADPASKSEIIEAIRDVVPEILHTKDGSRVGMHCVWYGTLKDRKVIVKSMKTFVTKIAMEEHGHMVLIALFDCFDDTVFLEKHIIKELVSHLLIVPQSSIKKKKKTDKKVKEEIDGEEREETEEEKVKTDGIDKEKKEKADLGEKDPLLEFLQNPHAKKVLIYLLNPRDPHYIHPDVINILKQGDNNITSKKDPEIRRAELKAIIALPLLNLIESNIERFYINNAFCLFTLVILQHTVGNRRKAFRAIADLVVEPYTRENKNTHPIEHSGSTYMYKQLIMHDKDESQDDVKFSEVLIETVPQMVFKSWMECNRGAFLLVSLLETEIPSVVERIKEELTGCKKYLSNKPYKGAEILIKKLK